MFDKIRDYIDKFNNIMYNFPSGNIASSKKLGVSQNQTRKYSERGLTMEMASKWLLSETEKDAFIATLTPNLLVLRTQADISQEELANLLGISRQTYSAIERNIRRMSWNTYLSLILFFDHNKKTHKMLRMLSLFPKELVVRFNDGEDYSSFELSTFLGAQSQEIIEQLDDQAKQTIHSIVMMEYARCTQLPSDAIIKSFGGVTYIGATARDRDAAQALKAIQQSVAHE